VPKRDQTISSTPTSTCRLLAVDPAARRTRSVFGFDALRMGRVADAAYLAGAATIRAAAGAGVAGGLAGLGDALGLAVGSGLFAARAAGAAVQAIGREIDALSFAAGRTGRASRPASARTRCQDHRARAAGGGRFRTSAAPAGRQCERQQDEERSGVQLQSGHGGGQAPSIGSVQRG
jgi:hypothetical protein